MLPTDPIAAARHLPPTAVGMDPDGRGLAEDQQPDPGGDPSDVRTGLSRLVRGG